MIPSFTLRTNIRKTQQSRNLRHRRSYRFLHHHNTMLDDIYHHHHPSHRHVRCTWNVYVTVIVVLIHQFCIYLIFHNSSAVVLQQQYLDITIQAYNWISLDYVSAFTITKYNNPITRIKDDDDNRQHMYHCFSRENNYNHRKRRFQYYKHGMSTSNIHIESSIDGHSHRDHTNAYIHSDDISYNGTILDTALVLDTLNISSSSLPSVLPSISSNTYTYSSMSTQGLSKFHLSILRQSIAQRQRFVTGRYPISISMKNNPTRKWLNIRSSSTTTAGGKHPMTQQQQQAETEVYVNGTIASHSLASLDRFYWLDDHERQMQQDVYDMISMELIAEIMIDRPGYVQILPSHSAGSCAATSYLMQQQLVQSKNGHQRWTLQGMKLLKLHSEMAKGTTTHMHNMYEPQDGIRNNDPSSSTIMSYLDMKNNTDRLWVTGFSLTGRKGLVTAIDCDQCYIQPVNDRSKNAMLWPNEVQPIPKQLIIRRSFFNTTIPWNDYQDALLVCDGFLVPTKDRGGIYVVKNPGHETEWTIPLSQPKDRWFYHRAVWVDLTGDGSLSILSARCQVSTVLDQPQGNNQDVMVTTTGIRKVGQLVWFECPKPFMIDPITGTPLESDGTIFDPFNSKHLPWKVRVLGTGPDVMFSVADLDTSDDTIEVIASEFFNQKVTLLSIQRGAKPKVVLKRIIDEKSGRAFGCILANLMCDDESSNGRCVVDSGSSVDCLRAGDTFSHVLVTSHECEYVAESAVDSNIGEEFDDGTGTVSPSTENELTSTSERIDGGSLFAYHIPEGEGAWKTEPWTRSVVASGFKVNGKLRNMINPGAPGFVYTFYANKRDSLVHQRKRPMIAIAGDCAESAYIFRPNNDVIDNDPYVDASTSYKLMVEIKCEATVGSIGIGYNDFSSVEQENGFAKLYIPCFEKDKILVFGLGSGDDDNSHGW